MSWIREKLLLLVLMCFFPPCACVQAQVANDPVNPVPSLGIGFFDALETFLRNEDADRFDEQFTSFVVSGGTHGTGAGLSGTPAAMIAYPGGYRVTEDGAAAITYSDDATCWVVAHKNETGNVGTFTRVANTHFLIRCGIATQPTLPVDSVYLMKVVTAGGSVTEVTDLRITKPVVAEIDCSNPGILCLFAASPSEGGPATTALALDATPSVCPAGQEPAGVLANGDAVGCTQVEVLPDGGSPPTNDGEVEFDRALKRLQLGLAGITTVEFVPLGIPLTNWLSAALVDNSGNGGQRFLAPFNMTTDCADHNDGCFMAMTRPCTIRSLGAELVLGTTASEALTFGVHVAATPLTFSTTPNCSCVVAAGGSLSCTSACGAGVAVAANDVVSISYQCDGANCPYDEGPVSVSALCE